MIVINNTDYHKIQGTKTQVNLARAFAGECQAYVRYEQMVSRAQADGLEELSNVFHELAKNESAHAKVWFATLTDNLTKKLDNIEIQAGFPFKGGSLIDLVQYAVGDESEEAERMYPEFARIAKEEGLPAIATRFTMVGEVESCHAKRLNQVFELLRTGSLYRKEKQTMFKCAHCGHEAPGLEPWKVCPICGHPQGFVMVNV